MRKSWFDNFVLFVRLILYFGCCDFIVTAGWLIYTDFNIFWLPSWIIRLNLKGFSICLRSISCKKQYGFYGSIEISYRFFIIKYLKKKERTKMEMSLARHIAEEFLADSSPCSHNTFWSAVLTRKSTLYDPQKIFTSWNGSLGTLDLRGPVYDSWLGQG